MIKNLIRLFQKERNITSDIVTFNKKKFRFSDWFAEKVIKTIAFLSIAIVVLIFIFVFSEAFPIFKMNKQETVSTELLGTGSLWRFRFRNINSRTY